MIQLYFGPGACSFVPHVALEVIKAQTGEDYEPKLVKLHKGEQKAPEYLRLNPDGLVPTLLVDGKPLTQIVAICDYLDRRCPQAEVRRVAAARFRRYLERIQEWTRACAPFWFGARLSFHDAYAFVFLRRGGYAGIDPASLPAYRAYAERVMAAPPVATVLERERIRLDTYKAAA